MHFHKLSSSCLPKVIYIDPSAISEGHVNLAIPGGRSKAPDPVSKLSLATLFYHISASDCTLSYGLTLEDQALTSMTKTFIEDHQDSYRRYFSQGSRLIRAIPYQQAWKTRKHHGRRAVRFWAFDFVLPGSKERAVCLPTRIKHGRVARKQMEGLKVLEDRGQELV